MLSDDELPPLPEPRLIGGIGDYGAAIPGIERPCTCHPDDNPPVPCTQKYALSECRAASGEPTEAQIEAVEDVLLAWEAKVSDRVSARALAEDVIRAALAAKEG